jgi:hypothetical protein
MTVPKRFGVLRFFATLLKVLAWIVLIGSILGAIGAAMFGNALTGMTGGLGIEGMEALAAGGGIVLGVLVLIGGLLYFLALYVAGESIHMQLAVEENTRLTAALLLRMHQEGQATDSGSSAYGAGGGFSNEPYE